MRTTKVCHEIKIQLRANACCVSRLGHKCPPSREIDTEIRLAPPLPQESLYLSLPRQIGSRMVGLHIIGCFYHL